VTVRTTQYTPGRWNFLVTALPRASRVAPPLSKFQEYRSRFGVSGSVDRAPLNLIDLPTRAAAGLAEVEETELTATVRHPDFDDWWQPFLLNIGPPGEYAASLDPERLVALRERCRELMPEGPFTNTAVAWAACGVVA